MKPDDPNAQRNELWQLVRFYNDCNDALAIWSGDASALHSVIWALAIEIEHRGTSYADAVAQAHALRGGE